MKQAISMKAESEPIRVKFGAGIRLTVANEVEWLGASRAMVLSTPEQSRMAMHIAERLGHLAAGVFTKAAMHTPVAVTEEALLHLKVCKANCLISIGGGSTIGLGKAIAYRTGLPQIAVPTTYSGSEATPILGQTNKGIKTTLSDPKILPDVILYDPELFTTLPTKMAISSGLNAMAHAAEALYAQNRNSASDAIAIEGLEAFVTSLPKVIAKPTDLMACEKTLHGAYACGSVLGKVGMGLHHKLCHTLGGSFDLPHADTHAIILPHVITYNARSAAAQLLPICEMLGGSNAGLALHNFSKLLGAPMALRDLGLKEEDLDRATLLTTSQPYPNPHPITSSDIRALLGAAWEGNTPII